MWIGSYCIWTRVLLNQFSYWCSWFSSVLQLRNAWLRWRRVLTFYSHPSPYYPFHCTLYPFYYYTDILLHRYCNQVDISLVYEKGHASLLCELCIKIFPCDTISFINLLFLIFRKNILSSYSNWVHFRIKYHRRNSLVCLKFINNVVIDLDTSQNEHCESYRSFSRPCPFDNILRVQILDKISYHRFN